MDMDDRPLAAARQGGRMVADERRRRRHAHATHVRATRPPGGLGSVSDRLQYIRVHYNQPEPVVRYGYSTVHYLNRPLPAPPPEDAIMPTRPSTSDGPRSQFAANLHRFDRLDKRVSRDDFYVSFRPQGASPSTDHQPRRQRERLTPARADMPPTAEGPRAKAASRPAVPLLIMPPSDSPSSDVGSNIGMALGSPAHPPADVNQWNAQQTLRTQPMRPVNPVSPLSTVESTASADPAAPKKSSGKWKLFGMFGKKNTEQSTMPSVSASGSPDLKTASGSRPEPSRSQTVASRKNPKHKPLVARSATMPYGDETTRLAPPPRGNGSTDKVGRIPIGLDTAGVNAGAGRLLDVDIPDSSMERYSIMFGNVLQEKGHSASSLLSRRQATLDRLKTISDEVAHEEERRQYHMSRRATSPQPQKSPSFTVLPPTPTRQETVLQSQKKTQLSRSNTSPAKFPSPSRATFGSPPFNPLRDHPGTRETPRGKMTIATLARSREQTSSQTPHRFSPDESSLILESPSDIDEPLPAEPSPNVIRSVSVKHHFQEPKWQMISPPSQYAPSTASSASSRKRSPSSISSAQTHITKPSTDLDSEGSGEVTVAMNPVEMSIARQISVSREQRKMLQPLQTVFGTPRPKASPASSKSPTPTPRIAMGKNERLAETRTATPTLVTPRETLDSQLAEHRKSEWVVLEE